LFSHQRLRLPGCLFSSGFSTRSHVCSTLLLHTFQIPRPSHYSWFDHPNTAHVSNRGASRCLISVSWFRHTDFWPFILAADLSKFHSLWCWRMNLLWEVDRQRCGQEIPLFRKLAGSSPRSHESGISLYPESVQYTCLGTPPVRRFYVLQNHFCLGSRSVLSLLNSPEIKVLRPT